MNPTPDPAALDEAVSAHLDGEPVDAALRASPEFAARLAELTGARDALRGADPVPPLDEVTRRRLVRAALDDAAPVGPSWYHRLTPLGAAAAVLAVILGIGALLFSVGGDDSTSGSASDSGSADREAATTQGDDGSGGEDSATDESQDAVGGAPLDLGDLGDVSDLDALATELRTAAPTTESDNAGPPGAAEEARPCAPEVAAAAPGPVVATGTGTFEGQPAIVVVTTDPAGEQAVLVATTADCEVHSAP